MSKAHGWTGLRAASLALGLFAAAAPAARATPLITYSTYSTQGSVDATSGVSGPGVVSFVPVSKQTFNSPSAFSLGEFRVLAVDPGHSTTYNHTPFSITFVADKVDGHTPTPNQTPIVLRGELDGTVSGPDRSSVKATFQQVAPMFQTGKYMNTLTIPDNPLTLVPSTTNGGQCSVQANLVTTLVSPQPAPEPASLALFLTALAGLGVRQRLRRRA